MTPAPTEQRRTRIVPDQSSIPSPLGRRGATLDQWYTRFLARERLPALERAVFDLVLQGEAVNLRQMAERVDHNSRRVHEAIDYLEMHGYIRCPVDTRGRRGAYLPADE